MNSLVKEEDGQEYSSNQYIVLAGTSSTYQLESSTYILCMELIYLKKNTCGDKNDSDNGRV